jgi:hypothetical protein
MGHCPVQWNVTSISEESAASIFNIDVKMNEASGFLRNVDNTVPGNKLSPRVQGRRLDACRS